MKRYFLIATSNIIDDNMVRDILEDDGAIDKNEDIFVVMYFEEKRHLEIMKENLRYTTGESSIIDVNPDNSSCTVYRYMTPDHIDEIAENIVPMLENLYDKTTGENLVIYKIYDKRKEFKTKIFGNLN